MSKTKRLIKVMMSLTQSPGISAQEIALQSDVTERTVYRYLNELKELGYPLYTGKDPETKLRKYSLKPLSFTGAEALAIVASCQPLLSQKGLPVSAEMETALPKITGAICDIEEQREFYTLEKGFTYLGKELRDYTPWAEHLKQISACIRNSKTIVVDYYSFSTGRVSERAMDPYHLYYDEGNLYLVAYCHKHKTLRTFKINRFQAIKKITENFKRDLGFSLKEYLGGSWRNYRGLAEIEVKIYVDPPLTRLFLETSYHESQEIEELSAGKICCSFVVYDSPEFRTWLLGWGRYIEVIEPEKLRAEIKEELRESLKKYEREEDEGEGEEREKYEREKNGGKGEEREGDEQNERIQGASFFRCYGASGKDTSERSSAGRAVGGSD